MRGKVGVVGWTLVLVVLGSRPFAAAEPFSLLLEAGPAYYRYTETGDREFSGLETEWADVAFRGDLEARYRAPAGVTPLLRFSGLTSAEDTETNNQGSPPTEMHVAYFFNVQPGAQVELHPLPRLRIAPEFSWDLDWYKQVRRSSSAGTVNETVFWQGPAVGGELGLMLAEAWALGLAYRHSFLIDVVVENSFTEGLGFDDFSTSGHRDVVELRFQKRLTPRWAFDLLYRFEIAQIDASSTETRGAVQAQFPDNEHIVNGLSFGATVGF